MLLVTGATGFLGRHLVSQLQKIDKKIKILVRKTSNISPFSQKKELEIVYGNLESERGLCEALNGVEIVIHCAARVVGKDFNQYYRTNTLGTRNLLNSMAHKGVGKILYLSSQSAAGPSLTRNPIDEDQKPSPVSSYGLSKKLAEDEIKRSKIRYTILRPVSVYGPYDTEILKYLKIINKGFCPMVGYGKRFVNLIYIKDLVNLIYSVVNDNIFNNRTYFVNDGKIYQFEELVDKISSILNKKVKKFYIPSSIASLYGLFCDLFLPENRRLVGRDKIKELGQRYWLCKNERAIKELGFKPQFPLERGMLETINWYQEKAWI